MALPPTIAHAFSEQATFCRRAGSPLTAAVCEAVALVADSGSATGRALIGWPGDPLTDALMMRVTGGINAIVRAGNAAELAPFYPPVFSVHKSPDPAALAAPLAALLADPVRDVELCSWLAGPPQTNEVGRAGALMPGLMAISAWTGLPMRLFELGCSAGLNLNLDRFGYDLGGLAAGDPASPVQLAPGWRGPPPPDAPVQILSRRGTDIAPLDVRDADVRARLMAYIWPDQIERVARAEAAITVAMAQPPLIDAMDAAEWVERHVAVQPGSTAVVYHSIAAQYFPAETQARIVAHLADTGAAASATAPLAWLRLEMDDPSLPQLPTLRLTLWRGGAPEERLLGRAHPHGTFVQWDDAQWDGAQCD